MALVESWSRDNYRRMRGGRIDMNRVNDGRTNQTARMPDGETTSKLFRPVGKFTSGQYETFKYDIGSNRSGAHKDYSTRSVYKRPDNRTPISFWDSSEGRPKPARSFTATTIDITYDKKPFVTQWRPTTTFGYSNEFEMRRVKKSRRSVSPRNAGKAYTYQSKPHFVRSRHSTAGIRLDPIGAFDTPNPSPKSKRKKKKKRKRNPKPETKTVKFNLKTVQKYQTTIKEFEPHNKAASRDLSSYHTEYPYASDFEADEASSADEGFGSEILTSPDQQTQTNAWLPTMQEEDEIGSDQNVVGNKEKHDNIEDSHEQNQDGTHQNKVSEKKDIILYSPGESKVETTMMDVIHANDFIRQVQNHIASHGFRGIPLKDKEDEYINTILQPQVDSLVLKTISQSLLETMEEESEFVGASKISTAKLMYSNYNNQHITN